MNDRKDMHGVEWRTVFLFVACYACWLFSFYLFTQIGYPALVLTVLATAFHSSLQHEVLHGHPTRHSLVNELFVFPAIGFWIPYRRYQTLHLLHHIDPQLTDPTEDPESWYVTSKTWTHMSWLEQRLLELNGTLLGRLLLGPAITWMGFWRADVRAMTRGDQRIMLDWTLHLVGLIPVWFILEAAALPAWQYILLIVYPATSIVLIRSFIEHRAAHCFKARTAVVEAGWFMRHMFLNNNLHAVHHRFPALPWYELPALWHQRRDEVLSENDNYLISGGYRDVARQWLLRRREPIVHPVLSLAEPKTDNQP